MASSAAAAPAAYLEPYAMSIEQILEAAAESLDCDVNEIALPGDEEE